MNAVMTIVSRALLATVRPRDVVGKTRRWLASELIHELVVIDKKIKTAKQELTELVGTTGSPGHISSTTFRSGPYTSSRAGGGSMLFFEDPNPITSPASFT